jgi:TatD DNase family protein
MSAVYLPAVTLPEPGAFDSHTHMEMATEKAGASVDELLDAARAAGVARVVNVGCDLASSRWSVTTAAEYPEVYAAVAMHPNDLPGPERGEPRASRDDPPYPSYAPDSVEGAPVLAEIESLAASPRVVAVGETGLDYYWGDTQAELQRDWFRAHIEIARRAGKPVMIHDRDAHEDVLATLAEYGPWPPFSVIFHCFSGDAKMARTCAEAGYVMSFAGNVTFKNAGSLREAALAAPADLMLAETDAPFLTPVPHRGKTNHPAMTACTIAFLAELKGLDLADFCTQLQSTGQKVFGW